MRFGTFGASGEGYPSSGFSGCSGFSATTRGLVAEGRSPGAVFTSLPVPTQAFDWLVAWWAAEVEGPALLGFEVQVGSAGCWSRWHSFGTWGSISSSGDEPPFGGDRGSADPGAPVGKVETDTLVLDSPADMLRYRMTYATPADAGADAGDASGAVAEIPAAACILEFGIVARMRHAPRPAAGPDFLRECAVDVPPRSQMEERAGIRGRICSPTCCAMALEAFGQDYPTVLVASACHDAGAGIYGNWPFNVAALRRLGADARLDWFGSMEAAMADLSAGRVLIASIAFRDGALEGAPIRSTSGHLVLVRGLSRRPDGSFAVLVNDPAAETAATVAREYRLDQFESAWKGVAYVVGAALLQ